MLVNPWCFCHTAPHMQRRAEHRAQMFAAGPRFAPPGAYQGDADEVEAFGRALEGNTVVQEVAVYGTKKASEWMRALSRVLAVNAALRKLTVAVACIGDAEAVQMAPCVARGVLGAVHADE